MFFLSSVSFFKIIHLTVTNDYIVMIIINDRKQLFLFYVMKKNRLIIYVRR
jgi:hypothetical protein